MRILFITRFYPYPPDVGLRKRNYAILRALARWHEVTLLTLSAGTEEVTPINEMGVRLVLVPKTAFQVHPYFPRELDPTRVGRLAYLLRSMEPLEFRCVSAAELTTTVLFVAKASYDLYWVARLQMARLFPQLDRSRMVVDLDDIEYVKRRATLRAIRFGPHKLMEYFEWWKLRRCERREPREYGAALVCSDDDLRRLGVTNARVLPNGVDVPAFPSEEPEERDTILFPGTMSYPPNIDAATFFCRDVLPRVRARRPGARLIIAGAAPSESIKALADGIAVVVTGYVPDMTSWFRRSTLVVVPLRAGSGTRIKILEAFAHGKAVVSTRLGAAGLDVQNGTHLRLADLPEAFAEACVRLLQDAEERRRLGANGHALVRARYDWRVIEPHVLEIAAEVAGRAARLAPREAAAATLVGR